MLNVANVIGVLDAGIKKYKDMCVKIQSDLGEHDMRFSITTYFWEIQNMEFIKKELVAHVKKNNGYTLLLSLSIEELVQLGEKFVNNHMQWDHIKVLFNSFAAAKSKTPCRRSPFGNSTPKLTQYFLSSRKVLGPSCRVLFFKKELYSYAIILKVRALA